MGTAIISEALSGFVKSKIARRKYRTTYSAAPSLLETLDRLLPREPLVEEMLVGVGRLRVSIRDLAEVVVVLEFEGTGQR